MGILSQRKRGEKTQLQVEEGKNLAHVITMLMKELLSLWHVHGPRVRMLMALFWVLVITCLWTTLIIVLRSSSHIDHQHNQIDCYYHGKNDDKNWMACKEKEYVQRRSRVAEVCSSLKTSKMISTTEIKADNFIVDLPKRMAMCRHAKVATSTLLAYFVRMSELIPRSQKQFMLSSDRHLHLEAATVLTPSNSSEIFRDIVEHRDVFTFSFVRHPFERLASAFRDKIVYRSDPRYYVLADNLTELSTDISSRSIFFESFLKHVLENPFGDRHWWPYYYRCAYCRVHYDVIGTMESFDEDLHYIFNRMGISHHPLLSTVKEKISRHSSSMNKGEDLSSRSLFVNISKEMKRKLEEVYQFDLLLFDYNLDDYM